MTSDEKSKELREQAKEKRQTGALGEKLACEHLKSEGFRIVSRNFRFGANEIDIIAANERYIVFTEVKTRASNAFGSPSSAVGAKKRKGIISAARGFLALSYFDLYPRFDIIEVLTGKGNEAEINHIEAAFDGTGRVIR